MKAAVYYNNNDVRIEEVEKPKLRDGEILVRIEASGICGSDVMEWYRIKKAPLVLGHEIAGVVVEVGKGVEKFKEGDRVTAAHHVPCNTCRYCLRGDHSVCDTLRATNFYPGGFCEYVRVPAINVDRGVFKLPDTVSFEDGSFSEPLGCVLRGQRACKMEAGKNVLVIGSGLSGLLHIKLAKALGAGKITATDISDFRLSAAKKCGADYIFKADVDVPSMMREATGRLADIVIICASADSAFKQGLESVDRAGAVMFFAPKEPGKTYPMPVFDMWRDNITVINSYASPPFDTLASIDLIESARVTVADIITHRLPLRETAHGFKLVAEARQSLKVIIEPQK
ncbi:alcohol dehydrogenase [bacterium]|nr:MAG: alcohol dehydrogenase [bacterium]